MCVVPLGSLLRERFEFTCHFAIAIRESFVDHRRTSREPRAGGSLLLQLSVQFFQAISTASWRRLCSW